MSEPLSSDAKGPVTDVDDIIDVFGQDDKPESKEDKPEKEEKETPAPDEEEDDIELKDDEPSETEEEKLDLKDDTEITAPPRKKEVLKEYPEFFKKFPWFEKMMYRDREMNELFGGFDGAKEAAGKAQTLDEMESAVSNGSSIELFSRIKEGDSAAFNKVVKNLLPNLQKVDREAYTYVVTDVIKRVLITANEQGKRADNEDLQSAVSILAGFVFPNGVPGDDEETKADPELEKERNEFNQERLQVAVTDVQNRIGNVLRNTVEQYIDPRDQMTPYVKKVAIRQVLESVDRELSKDVAFRKSVNKLWDDAQKSRYSKTAVDKVKSAYLGKSKGLLRKAILEARREALKDAPPSRRNNSDREENSSPRKGLISTGRSTSRNSGNGKPQMKPGESVVDFMMRDD